MAASVTTKIPLTQAALAGGKTTAAQIGPEPTKTGDARLTGKARKAVVLAGLLALSAKERAALSALDNESIHRWIAGLLDHSKCLLLGAAGYLTRVSETVGFDKHAPSVVGPAFIRAAITKIDAAPKEKAEPAPKKAKGQKAKKTEAEAPKAETAPAKAPAKRKLVKPKKEAVAV